MQLTRVGSLLIVLTSFTVRSLAGVTDSVGLEWVRQYGSRNIESIASDLDVDSSGNIYMLGTGVQPSGIGNFLTVKYRPDGSEVWAVEASHQGADLTAAGLAVDKTSGVVITGYSYAFPAPPFSGFVTLKLDSLANEVWRTVYDNPDYEYESNIGVGLDSIGNAYVVGTDWAGSSDELNFRVIKYSLDGQELWVSGYGYWLYSGDIPIDFAVNPAGTTHATGKQSFSDHTIYGTAVFSSSGGLLWSRGEDDEGEYNVASGVTYDFSGNTYVTGVSDNANGFIDRCVTIKYNRTGQELWERIYESGSQTVGRRVSVAAGGDVYVAARSDGDVPLSTDIILIKYDSVGTQQWVARYDGSDSTYPNEDPMALAVDEDSNIYVAGYSPPSTTLLKYSSDGALLWTQTYHDTLETDVPVDMVVDGRNVYVLATSSSAGGASYLTLLKYSPYYPSAPGLRTPLDNAIVTADSAAFTWLPASRNPQRYWFELSADSLFENGFIDSSLTDTATTITSFVHNQMYWWKVRAGNDFGWGPFSMVRAFLAYQEIPLSPSLLLPENGATGASTAQTFMWNSSPGTSSYSIQLADTVDFSTLFMSEDSVYMTFLDVSGLINGTTYYWRVNATNDLGTSGWSEEWRFTTSTTDVEDLTSIPIAYTLAQNYPNPFNPSTVIRYGIPVRSTVRLEIFNVLGQRVGLLVDDIREAGYHQAHWQHSIASGVYLYKMVATPLEGEREAYTEVRKMLMMK